jgi:glucokinase
MRDALGKTERTIASAVVGMPGPVDYENGEVLRLPNLPNWEGRVTAARLSAELGIPALVANDADLAALGEHRYGAGQRSRDMVYVTVSTGVGAGVILGGKLLHGRLSLAEAGHTIIDRSTYETVEGLGSGTALGRLAGEDPAALTARAKAGDSDALSQFASVAEALAIGVFNLVHSFSPEVVVIGGGMSAGGQLLLEPIRKLIARCSSSCPASRVRVLPAKGGDDVGLKGSAAYWADSQGNRSLSSPD